VPIKEEEEEEEKEEEVVYIFTNTCVPITFCEHLGSHNGFLLKNLFSLRA